MFTKSRRFVPAHSDESHSNFIIELRPREHATREDEHAVSQPIAGPDKFAENEMRPLRKANPDPIPRVALGETKTH